MSALSSDQVCALTGLTYRQVDHWCRAGYLAPVGGVGTGSQRRFPAAEVRIALLMKRLVDAGLTPLAAVTAARNEGVIAPGVVVAVAGELVPDVVDVAEMVEVATLHLVDAAAVRAERDAAIVAAYAAGTSPLVLASRYSLTRQRIHKIATRTSTRSRS